jgi:hypothetical protein
VRLTVRSAEEPRGVVAIAEGHLQPAVEEGGKAAEAGYVPEFLRQLPSQF